MGRKRAQVTLTDVAKRAGVSVATASKALNERDEVAAATRDRVRQAAEELKFHPNVLARGLISGNTRTVGLLTDELSAARFAIRCHHRHARGRHPHGVAEDIDLDQRMRRSAHDFTPSIRSDSPADFFTKSSGPAKSKLL